MTNNYKRGQIYWVDFSELEGENKSSGTEINGKKRPIVVISNNFYNEKSSRIASLPLSSKVKNIRIFELFLGKVVINDPKNRESKVMIDQIRVIDKAKLREKGGELTPKQMTEIEEILKKFLELTEKIKAKL
ncbi:mRNA interferase [endosymbiont DhMRE of Dentiscutata heterogama]|uniref:type II toxin-antitoxin system PemK/MazF family toxin n=1 Tax=endosymbiont DhMRE of Dentiscutata heterogama TaxID=1609546 RepID=UPI00062F5442|nr:type II toxin-antitoxin system PemK/MazF family toxin [endosymbiont DhMRE of Dentiscutata heterogama]CFW92719.1 mRNA interferase [endosymbiont DhMRE of Dentiscutata heterogama]